MVKEANYLGFIVSKEGCSPDPKKTQGLVQMKPPKTKRQVRHFIGGVNFYRKMSKNRSHPLAPLTELTRDAPFEWKPHHQDTLNKIKVTMSKEAMLCYPGRAKPFFVCPDASDKQLEAHATQIENLLKNADFSNVEEIAKLEHRLVLFYSKKLSDC